MVAPLSPAPMRMFWLFLSAALFWCATVPTPLSAAPIPEEKQLAEWPREWPALLQQALTHADWPTSTPVTLQLPEALVQAQSNAEVWRIAKSLHVGNVYPDEPFLRHLHERGVRTVVSFDVIPPDALTARALGLQWVWIPTLGHSIDEASLLRLMLVTSTLDSTFYLHAGPGEVRAYPTAAVMSRWLDSRFRRNPLLPLKQLHAMNYPAVYQSGWHTALSPLQLLQNQYERFPKSFTPLKPQHSLLLTMRELDYRIKALQETVHRRDTPPHLSHHSPREDARLIADLTQRWADLSVETEWKTGFQRTADAAAELERAARTGHRTALPAALLNLQNQCMACHTQLRDTTP
jgi:hypothetical protein